MRSPLLITLLAGCAGAAHKPPPELVNDSLPAWMTKGEEVRIAVARTLLETGETTQALGILRQMRADGYRDPEIDLLQGMALHQDGVTSEAERLLQMARNRMPRDHRPFSQLCVLYAEDKRVEEAIEACGRATQVGDTHGKAWNNLAVLLLTASRNDEALAAAEQALERDASSPLYRNNLALAQAALGKSELAYRTFHSTMSEADAAYMVGVAIERTGDVDGARVWYEKGLEIDPEHERSQHKLQGPTEEP